MGTQSSRKTISQRRRMQMRCLLFLGFAMVFGWFGIRLAETEHPDEWRDANITIADIQYISRKPDLWKMTDTEGNTYSVFDSDAAAQILPHKTYHIVYAPGSDNAVRAITQGDTIIVDYAHSIAVHCERSIWDWILAILGLIGTLTISFRNVADIRKAIKKDNGG